MNILSKEEALKKLKAYWKTDSLILEGKFTKQGSYGFFNDVVLEGSGRTLVYPDKKGFVSVYSTSKGLEDGEYYSFEATISTDEHRTDNPYKLQLKDGTNPTQIKFYRPTKDYIEHLFFSKGGEDPKGVATIASQLSLNGLELYTETERFIFELLQNADDMPHLGQEVNVYFQQTENMFLFMHNGKPFTRKDVDAISDAARSNKTGDSKKTGYKGIGFKSVFTDSECVYIYSNGFQFRYDKGADIYRKFDDLYKVYFERMRPEEAEKIRSEYRGIESEFEDISNISWQIKPIWTEYKNFPKEIPNVFYKNNVAIALQIGKDVFRNRKYNSKIFNLFKEPRFLLFLRNIKSISILLNNGTEIKVFKKFKKEDGSVKISAYKHKSIYAIQSYDVGINEDSIKEVGIPINITKNSQGNREFRNKDNVIIKNIPDKLIQLEKTAIVFAAQIDNNNRIKKAENSILFNYLPTSDENYEFPFLVNADFVTKTDREFILKENLWNHYLFYHIGYHHVKWVASLASEEKADSYLNIIVNKLKNESEDNSYYEINGYFNKGFKKAINEVPFVLTTTNELKKASEVIIDKSEISDLFGVDLFYDLCETDLHLIHPKLSKKIIGKNVFDVENFSIKNLCNVLATEDGQNTLYEWVVKQDEDKYEKFLKLIDSKYLKYEEFEEIFNDLSIIKFGEEFYSISEIIEDEDLLLLNSKTNKIKDFLSKLFTTSTINIALFNAIHQICKDVIPYFQNNELLDKIEAKTSQPNSLEKNERKSIFDSLRKLINDDKRMARFELFQNSSNVIQPLNEMIGHQHPEWLNQFKIGDEFLDGLDDFLIDTSIYSKVIIPNWRLIIESPVINANTIVAFYESVTTYYNQDTKVGKYSFSSSSEFEFIYTGTKFIKHSIVYFDEYLCDITKEEFKLFSSILKKTNQLLPPQFEVLSFFKNAPFKIGNNNKSHIFDSIDKEEVRQHLTEKEIHQLFKYDKSKTANKAICRNTSGEFKALNELLPLSENFVPIWLQTFQIHEDFRPYEQDLKGKMITSNEVYEEIVLGEWDIVSTEIESVVKENKVAIIDVYDIITRFYNDNPHKKIREKLSTSEKTNNFIFTDDIGEFITDEDAFYNENYEIIENSVRILTNGHLPNKSIIPYLINEQVENSFSPFYTKDFEYLLLDNLKPETSFQLDFDGAVTLIEYCKKHKENLFNIGYINEKFQFIIDEDIKQYFVPIEQPMFSSFIQNYFSEIAEPLPKGLSETSTVIGLLKGSSLYNYIVKNLDGSANEYFEFLDIIKEESLISEQHTPQAYLNKIDRLDFKYDVDGKPNEFGVKYIRLYYESYKDKTDFQNKILELRDIVYIDNILLSEIEAKPQIKAGQYRFEYNEIIKESTDNTYLVDWLKKPFNKQLQEAVFTTNEEDIDDTYKLFKDAYDGGAIDVKQFLFVLYYDADDLQSYEVPNRVDLIKDFFENTFRISEEFTAFIGLDKFNKVYPSEYAFDSEVLSEDVLKWIDNDTKKVKYLSDLGLNALKSTVVKVRRYFTKETIEFSESESIEVLIARLKQNKVFLENTLYWLNEKKIIFSEIRDKTYLKNLQSLYEGIDLKSYHPILVYKSIADNDIKFKFIKNEVPKLFIKGFTDYASSSIKINLFNAVTEGNGYLINKDEFYRNIDVPNEEKIRYVQKLDKTNINDSDEWNSEIYKIAKAISLPVIIYPQHEKLRFWDTFNNLKIKLTGTTRFYHRYKDNKPISENNERTILFVYQDKLQDWSGLSEINLEETEKSILYAAEQFIITRDYLLGNRNISDYNTLIETVSQHQFLLKGLIVRVAHYHKEEGKEFRKEWLKDLKPIYDNLIWDDITPLLVYSHENSKIKYQFVPYDKAVTYYHGLGEIENRHQLRVLQIIESKGDRALFYNSFVNDDIKHNSIIIEDTLDIEYLINTRRSISDDHYYNQWSNKANYSYQIYFISGNIRNKITFLNYRLDDYPTADRVLKKDGDIYLSSIYENELETILKDNEWISDEAFEELKKVKVNEYEKRNKELQSEVETLKQALYGESVVIDDETREVLTGDAYNFETGYIGEAFAYEELKRRGYKNVVWCNQVDAEHEEWGSIIFNDSTYHIRDLGEPYDLIFEDDKGNLNYVQVKSTTTGFGKSDTIKFPISVNEWNFMENDEVRKNYYLARVFSARSEFPSLRLIKMIYQPQ